jgi:two-component system, chemotaxis family, response regulator Rcp1
MGSPSDKPLILVIEADSHQAQLIAATLHQDSVQYDIQIISDGIQALDFLHGRGEYPIAPRPALILLDLNLPQKDGREILAEIKGHPTLKRIPIVVLTTSSSPEDIFETYRQQGNCYIIKPGELDRLTQTIERIKEFWLTIATLPSR